MLFGTDLPGFPSLIVSLTFFSGVQLLSLGIIGEYVGRIFAGGETPAALRGGRTGGHRR